MSPKMPIGATAMTQPVIRIMAWKRPFQKSFCVRTTVSGRSVSARPKISEKKISGSIWPSAAAATGFSGTIRRNTSTRSPVLVSPSCSVTEAALAWCRPNCGPTGSPSRRPGWMRFTSNRPVRMASRLVVMYQAKVLLNRRPRLRLAPTPATPEMIEPRISGTITILRDRRKSVPRKS